MAIHPITSIVMINKHYQDLSDDCLVKIHNQLFSERTTSIKNKVLKKEMENGLKKLVQVVNL